MIHKDTAGEQEHISDTCLPDNAEGGMDFEQGRISEQRDFQRDSKLMLFNHSGGETGNGKQYFLEIAAGHLHDEENTCYNAMVISG